MNRGRAPDGDTGEHWYLASWTQWIATTSPADSLASGRLTPQASEHLGRLEIPLADSPRWTIVSENDIGQFGSTLDRYIDTLSIYILPVSRKGQIVDSSFRLRGKQKSVLGGIGIPRLLYEFVSIAIDLDGLLEDRTSVPIKPKRNRDRIISPIADDDVPDSNGGIRTKDRTPPQEPKERPFRERVGETNGVCPCITI